MAVKIRNTGRVRVTFTSTGTTITIAATVANFRSLVAAGITNGDTFPGAAAKGGEWCAGLLTYNAGLVTQTDIKEGSSGTSPVSFSSGDGELFIDAPSDWFDELNLSAVTVLSASTCDIGAVHAAKIIVSGTTTITSFGTTAHKRRFVHFSGALTLTHNATSLILPSAANIVTAAGDTAIFMSDSSGNWRCYAFQRASGALGVVKPPQVFTASGTYTPSAGMLYCIIECVGGGGGGGSAAGSAANIYTGGGGGSGGYSRVMATAATIGASKTVTIGAGGAGGAAGSNNGAAGGDTSVGTLSVGKGGAGGTFGSAANVGAGGAGGVAGTGDITPTGSPGMGGQYNTALASITPSGMGGSSIFGGGARSIASITAQAGNNATNYGSGGGGAYAYNTASNFAGGNGTAGIVIITEFCL
jgi:hypothetical protein